MHPEQMLLLRIAGRIRIDLRIHVLKELQNPLAADVQMAGQQQKQHHARRTWIGMRHALLQEAQIVPVRQILPADLLAQTLFVIRLSGLLLQHRDILAQLLSHVIFRRRRILIGNVQQEEVVNAAGVPQIAERGHIAVAGQRGRDRAERPRQQPGRRGADEVLVVGAQRLGDAGILGPVDEIVLHQKAGQIGGDAFHGHRLQAEGHQQFHRREDIGPGGRLRMRQRAADAAGGFPVELLQSGRQLRIRMMVQLVLF